MGFIEALIAIIITGTASVILMQMASSALKEAVQNEKIDVITMHAVEGANITSKIIKEKDIEFNLLPSTDATCYIPATIDGKTWDFSKKNDSYDTVLQSEIVDSQTSTLDRESEYFEKNSKTAPILDEDRIATQYFRISCLIPAPEDASGEIPYVNVTIYVAHIPSSGTITNETEIKDYKYFTTVRLDQ